MLLRFRAAASLLVSTAFPVVALAVPTHVISEDTPDCDPLLIPFNVDELGNPPAFAPFPDEIIISTATFTQQSACPAMDNPAIPNALVVMTNMTGRAFRDLWYVGDFGPRPAGGPGPQTTLSNVDGLVHTPILMTDNGLTFKIDTIGVNRPLVFESIAFDGIFAPGEFWEFIIQDYMNVFGIPPAALGSIGVAGESSGGPESSGSIIAIQVPEPGTAGLLAAALTIAVQRRRRF